MYGAIFGVLCPRVYGDDASVYGMTLVENSIAECVEEVGVLFGGRADAVRRVAIVVFKTVN